MAGSLKEALLSLLSAKSSSTLKTSAMWVQSFSLGSFLKNVFWKSFISEHQYLSFFISVAKVHKPLLSACLPSSKFQRLDSSTSLNISPIMALWSSLHYYVLEISAAAIFASISSVYLPTLPSWFTFRTAATVVILKYISDSFTCKIHATLPSTMFKVCLFILPTLRSCQPAFPTGSLSRTF